MDVSTEPTRLRRLHRDICFFGRKGSGKNLSMVYYAFLSFLKGKRIYSNFKLEFPHTLVRSLDDIREVHDGILLADDFENWASSKFRSNVDKQDLLDITLDFGKRQVDFWYSTKRPMEIDKTIRSITDKFVRCNLLLVADFSTVEDYLDVSRYLDNYVLQLDVFDASDLETRELLVIIDHLPIWGSLYDTLEEVDQLQL